MSHDRIFSDLLKIVLTKSFLFQKSINIEEHTISLTIISKCSKESEGHRAGTVEFASLRTH